MSRLMKTTRALALVVGLVALGVGCSSEEPAPGPTQTPTITAPASPAALSREDAGQKYLGLVEPFNTQLDKCLPVLNPVLESGSAMMGEVSKVRKSCSGVAEANRTFAVELGKVSWPSEAGESVGQLIDELHADQMAWEGIGKAKSLSDLLEPEYPLTEDGPAAGLVRAHLGLPPVEDIEE